MNNISLEPPSKRACYVDVQCHYADVNVPSDQDFCDWVEKTLRYLIDNTFIDKADTELSIVIVDKTESQALNYEYRQQDTATNILSFPFDTPDIFKQTQETKILGDLVICAVIIEEQAKQQNKQLQEHWAHILVHGVLHLLDYDHINDEEAKIMEDLEIKILSQFGINDPYLELIDE